MKNLIGVGSRILWISPSLYEVLTGVDSTSLKSFGKGCGPAYLTLIYTPVSRPFHILAAPRRHIASASAILP